MSQELTTERLLSLRALPIFGVLPISDLQVIARYTSDRQFRAGAPIHGANEVLDRIQILTHGQISIFRPGEETERRVENAPFAVGVFPVLAQSMVDYQTTAVTKVRAVELDGRRLGDLFDEYPRLLLHSISQTAQLLLQQVQGRIAFAVQGSMLEEVREPPAGKLDLVERIFFLRQILPLERTSIDALASIARQLTPHTFAPGERIWKTGDRGDTIVMMLRGGLEAKHGEERVSRGVSGAIGGIEALAGGKRWYDLEAHEETEVLTLPVDVVIDAFEEHTDMGLDFLAFLATLMLLSGTVGPAQTVTNVQKEGATESPDLLPPPPKLPTAGPELTGEPASETVES